ncbi:CC_3452 family protein [Sphingomonas sp. Tas61C01]|uniref:CC_3452 family protein n=1 Tax=Sphingomonas sp. Tas61C01 TaxID=3458297 RepID=UPI00403E43A9
MKSFVALAAAFAVSATLIAATAADAQAPGAFYVATPASPTTKTSLVTRNTAWSLRGGAFVAAQAPERAQILCQLVADHVGGLSGFTVKGEAYDADQLAKCNAHVKPAPAQMVAR